LASPQIAEDYSTARLLLRLPGYSPMPAFGNVVDVPLVTRKARRSRAEVRAGLGVSDDAKLVLYQFGGQVNALHASASPRRLDAN
jgi:L-arabinokinase